MKWKFVLCAVLLFGIVYAVAAEEKDNSMDDMFVGCKAIGLCRIAMSLFVRTIRNSYKHNIKSEFPDQVDCIMTECDKNLLFENILKIVIIRNNVKLSAAESRAQVAAIENQIDEQIKETANLCGVEAETFSKFWNESRDSSSSEETITTSSNTVSNSFK